METRKRTGYTDKNGIEIRTGDIVRFHFDADRGYSDVKHPDYTEMIDLVIFDKKREQYYMMSRVGRGALVSRHAEHCEIIGSWDENKALLSHWEKDYLDEIRLKNYTGKIII